MLAEEAETVATDAKRAGLFQVHAEKQAEKDKCSWVVRATTATGKSIALKDAAALAAYLKSPGLRKTVASKETPEVQQSFIDSYGGRFGHFTHIEEPKDTPIEPLATA